MGCMRIRGGDGRGLRCGGWNGLLLKHEPGDVGDDRVPSQGSQVERDSGITHALKPDFGDVHRRWAKRQLDKAGIAYEALDNGFRWCADPAALQRMCNRLAANAVHIFWRWFHRLPTPFYG